MPDKVTLVAVIMAGIVLLVGLSAFLLIQEARRRDLQAHIMQTIWGRPVSPPAFSGLVRYLHTLGDRVLRGGWFYPERDLEHFQNMIAAAGYNPRRALPLLLGTKLMLIFLFSAIGLILASVFFHTASARFFVVGTGLGAGIYVPNLMLSALRRSHEAALQRGTPDALDLLVVCSEAGMGLESALERVAQEMRHSNRAVAIALSGLLDDLRILPDRREAFQNFGRRSGVGGLQRLATLLAQALQFGTPLGQALRAVAAELRRERANKLEERAVKLPAKLLFPMVLFIMPSLFVIVGGSTFLRLIDLLWGIAVHLPPVHH